MKFDGMLVAFGGVAVLSGLSAIMTLIEGDTHEAMAWFVASVAAASYCGERLRIL
jgi:hypothetical protein